jgi:two-component system, chemotaxis family, protein-glutamate methylesterase/glutaminase
MKAHPDIVAIGASSGGIEALQGLLEALLDLDAIVLVVLHRPANRASYLRDILLRNARMPVVVASHAERLHKGVCYIGEPSQHLMVGPDLRADLLPDHRYTTRNIDQLFMSLARHFGPRTIGVVLSGQLDDGTRGLAAIKKAGGIAMVQSPQEAAYPDMPRNAINYGGPIDLVAPTSDLAAEIIQLTGTVPTKRLASIR